MKISKISLLFFGFYFFCTSAQVDAQVNLNQRSLLEVKFGLGGTIFLGDLGGSKGSGKIGFLDFDLSSLRQNASFGLKVNLSNKISIRGDFFKARLFGDDALSGNVDRMNRNLSFRADLTEVSVTTELVTLNIARLRKFKTNSAEIYAFLGFGWIHFNPQAQYLDKWYDLQPMGTEGQGIVDGKEKYSLNSVVIPFGFGFRKKVAKSTYFGIEVSMRKTSTDYLDDVSGRYANFDVMRENHGDIAANLSDRRLDKTVRQPSYRGNPGENDNYSFLQFTFAQGFGKRKTKQQLVIPWKMKSSKNKKKCPDFR